MLFLRNVRAVLARLSYRGAWLPPGAAPLWAGGLKPALSCSQCRTRRAYARIHPLAIVRLLIQRWTRLEGPGIVTEERLELERRHIQPAFAEYEFNETGELS